MVVTGGRRARHLVLGAGFDHHELAHHAFVLVAQQVAVIHVRRQRIGVPGELHRPAYGGVPGHEHGVLRPGPVASSRIAAIGAAACSRSATPPPAAPTAWQTRPSARQPPRLRPASRGPGHRVEREDHGQPDRGIGKSQQVVEQRRAGRDQQRGTGNRCRQSRTAAPTRINVQPSWHQRAAGAVSVGHRGGHGQSEHRARDGRVTRRRGSGTPHGAHSFPTAVRVRRSRRPSRCHRLDRVTSAA
jgi:hypothetical protein